MRWWRERRGFSQLDLAGAAETTQRHLSFLESGRASPSPEMILRLATVLDIRLRQQNALLLAAGFAPAWRESDLSAPELAQVNGAVDYMLAQQEPYPAFVVDRRWNLLRANAGAGRFVEFLTGPVPATAAVSAEPVLLRERQILEALGDGPSTIPALVERIYAAVPQNLHAMAGPSVASHLKKLARENRVREHAEPNAPSRWELV